MPFMSSFPYPQFLSILFLFSFAIHSECFMEPFIQNMLFNLAKWEIIIKQEIWTYEYWFSMCRSLAMTWNVMKRFRRL